MSLRLLVVEDDLAIRSMLQSALTAAGFTVQTAVTLSEATALVRHSLLDLMLLDLGLPDGDGIELVRRVRAHHSLPILVISARQDKAEKVKLLDGGADDYLTKPFDVSELLARIRVALRHRGTTLSPVATEYECDGLRVDLNRRLVEVNGHTVHLTPTEYSLLARLVRSAGKVVTHRQLLTDVWGLEFVDHTHYLRLYMGQLRAKLEMTPADPQYLLTESGVGYRLTEAC